MSDPDAEAGSFGTAESLIRAARARSNAALVTPPVGLNLFVVQNLRKSGSLNDVIIGTLPFVVALFVILGLLAAFPDLALWLPRVVG